MPLFKYVVAVSVFLLVGLFVLSAVLQPVATTPDVRLGPPAKTVATTADEMAAQARADAASVEEAMRKRNPPPPPATAADLSAASAAQKIQRNAEATLRPSKKKWNPPPPPVAAADLSAAPKTQRNAEETPRAAKKKWRNARSHQRQKGEQSYAQGQAHPFGSFFGGVPE